MIDNRRQGDGKYYNVPPRMNRILRIRDKWYFLTRERARFGPFDSKLEAEAALNQFLDSVKNTKDQIFA